MKYIVLTAFALTLLCQIPSTEHYVRPKPELTYTKVSITKYGPTGKPMANGQMPYEGAVAVSDRAIPLGTTIILEGKEYVVKDRTAGWVHKKHGLTVDIYSNETEKEMLKFGRKIAYVVIK